MDTPRTLTFEFLSGTRDTYGTDWAAGGRRAFADAFDRLYYVEQGEVLVKWDGRSARLTPGRLGLFPGGPPARYYACPRRMRLAWVHFRVEAVPGVSLFVSYQPPPVVSPAFDPAPHVRRLLEQIDARTPLESVGAAQELSRLLQPFLPDDWTEILKPGTRTEQLLPAIEHMRRSSSRPLSLDELAATVHLHPTYFVARFREAFGTSPVRYHLELRLRKARMLLLSSKRPIGEIAAECGFDDPLYFSRFFRKRVGLPPRAFRACGGRVSP